MTTSKNQTVVLYRTRQLTYLKICDASVLTRYSFPVCSVRLIPFLSIPAIYLHCSVFAVSVTAALQNRLPDRNSFGNLGNGAGLQFITGACLFTADCNQDNVPSCCAFLVSYTSTGICSSIAARPVDGQRGCGYGDKPECSIDKIVQGPVGFRKGTQSNGGQCFFPDDCSSGCCAARPGRTSVCKDRLAARINGENCNFSCL